MAAGGSHSATYVYTYAVYRMLMRGVRERNRWWLWKHILICEVLMLVIAIGVAAWEKPPTAFGGGLLSSDAVYTLLAAGLMLAALVVVIDLLFDRLVHRLVFRRFSAANATIAVNVDDSGLHCSRQGIASKVEWAAIKDTTVLLDRSACVLWFGKREGLVIPRTGFANEQKFNSACAFMKDKVGVP